MSIKTMVTNNLTFNQVALINARIQDIRHLGSDPVCCHLYLVRKHDSTHHRHQNKVGIMVQLLSQPGG